MQEAQFLRIMCGDDSGVVKVIFILIIILLVFFNALLYSIYTDSFLAAIHALWALVGPSKMDYSD